MIVLALDTTTRVGSLALLAGDECLAELSGDGAITHGQRLPGELMELMTRARIPVGRVDLLAVAAGPGSFTGLRVGIAAMQGLAVAIGRRIVPVSALDALALAGAGGERLVATWMDAQRGQVFGALYDAAGRHLLTGPTVLSPRATLDLVGEVSEEVVRFVGDGSSRYVAEIRDALGARAQIAAPVEHLARWVGRIAMEAPDRAVAPHAVSPIYVRRPDAELARDERQRRG